MKLTLYTMQSYLVTYNDFQHQNYNKVGSCKVKYMANVYTKKKFHNKNNSKYIHEEATQT